MPDWCCHFKPRCRPALRSFWWRRCCTSAPSCSAASAACSGRCFPAATSKRSVISKSSHSMSPLPLWERHRPPSAAVLWLVCLIAMFAAAPARAQDRLNVVASFSILGDFARNVGGERVNVTTLVGPDGDVHVYTPAPADAKKIADAKLVIINGLGLEGWLPRLVQSSGGKTAIVAATNGIAPLKIGGDADPHAWQSVANARIYVANIRDALVDADAPAAGVYRANAQSYLAKLDSL